MLPENFFIFSKQDVDGLSASKLFGYGITEDAVIIGTKGLSEYRSAGRTTFPEEGRFSGIFVVSDDELIIRTDATGQDMLYLFQQGDDWAVSNSFLLLAEAVKKKTKLHTYAPSIVGFHLKDGVHVGEQLISHRTMIEEITVVPLTHLIHVNRRTGEISMSRSSYMSVFSLAESDNYEEKFLDTMERGAGILAAMSERNVPMHLLLSGGYDSRLALCMLMANGTPQSTFRVSSHEFKHDDFQSAKGLCEFLDLPMNVPGPQKKATLSDTDAIRMFLIGSGGTYLPFYPVSSHYIQKDAELRITGDQPTGWSHFAGRAKFNGNAEKIASDIEQALDSRGFGRVTKDEFLSTFDILDIDPHHPAAMLAHYSSIRSRHHCGRNPYRSLGVEYLFTPLMQSSFVALDLHNASKGFHPKKFFADAFSAFGGWALEKPFETPDRAFDRDLLDSSPFKGGASIKPRKYKVWGDIEGSSTETGVDFYSIGINSSPNPEKIKPYICDMFYKSHVAKASPFFNDADFAKANGEIHTNGTLSHGYRKTTHIVVTDIVLRIIEESSSVRAQVTQ